MVSVLISRLSGPGLSPGWGTWRCVLEQDTTLTAPLPTQVDKWIPANLMLGVTLRLTSIPPGGSRNALSSFMLHQPEQAPAW